MSFDGSHLICKKCLEETVYSTIEKEWICIKCKLKEIISD